MPIVIYCTQHHTTTYNLGPFNLAANYKGNVVDCFKQIIIFANDRSKTYQQNWCFENFYRPTCLVCGWTILSSSVIETSDTKVRLDSCKISLVIVTTTKIKYWFGQVIIKKRFGRK